jgi:hypothetical protein
VKGKRRRKGDPTSIVSRRFNNSNGSGAIMGAGSLGLKKLGCTTSDGTSYTTYISLLPNWM